MIEQFEVGNRGPNTIRTLAISMVGNIQVLGDRNDHVVALFLMKYSSRSGLLPET